MSAPRTYTLYLTDGSAVPIAPGITVSAYPYGSSRVDANLVDRAQVQPGGTGTVYFNNLSPGLDYVLDSDDGSFGPSYFHSGAAGQASVQSGATPPSGGGGGGTPAPVIYKVVGAGMGTFNDTTGGSLPSSAQSELFTSAKTYTSMTGDDQIGADFFSPLSIQMIARETPPDAATTLRFTLDVEVQLEITPPAAGVEYEVQLGLARTAQGVDVTGEHSFSSTITITHNNSGEVVLHARYIAMSDITGGNYINIDPEIALFTSDGSPLVFSAVTAFVAGSIEAFAAPGT